MSVGTGHQEDSFIHGLRHISRPEQDLGSALTESDSDVDRDSVKPKPDLDSDLDEPKPGLDSTSVGRIPTLMVL